MREPPQNFGHQYDRPNQPWVCGLAANGEGCAAGPSAHGQCPAMAECVPRREADRWQCARSALRGGPCPEGPTPEGGCCHVHRCHPVRSLRTIRGRFVKACTLLAAGGLLILLSADWRDRAISPGPLTDHHAQLMENTSASPNCSACHAAAERSVAGWTASLVASHGSLANQPERCMECHNRTISPSLALAAHNLPLDSLRRLTEDPHNTAADADIACAACHREHQGAAFDITAIDDAACQTCHQRKYDSFTGDHPEFGPWPYERRTRIAFNHASHSGKHFAEKKQSFDCRSCHLEDSTRGEQLLASYKSTCASCHDEKITTSVAKGVPIISLPTLDVATLRDAGHDIGDWPEDANGDFDGKLPPIMKVLLAGDLDAVKAMEVLGPECDFFDVDPDDPDELEACATLAAAIKKVIAELADDGSAAAANRLRLALDVQVTEPQLASLLAGIPNDLLSTAATEWLPDAKRAGVVKTADASETASDVPASIGQRSLSLDAAGTWARDDATLSIRYTPVAHSDPVLASWLEMLTVTPSAENQSVAAAALKEMSKPTAPGLCASCHSVERTGEHSLTINWRAYDGTSSLRGLTKFSHRPHLMLPQLENCTSCHAIDNSKSTPVAYSGDNPHKFVGDFLPLTKQQCAQCHNAKAAGQSCQKCHTYHVDEIEGWRLIRSARHPHLTTASSVQPGSLPEGERVSR